MSAGKRFQYERTADWYRKYIHWPLPLHPSCSLHSALVQAQPGGQDWVSLSPGGCTTSWSCVPAPLELSSTPGSEHTWLQAESQMLPGEHTQPSFSSSQLLSPRANPLCRFWPPLSPQGFLPHSPSLSPSLGPQPPEKQGSGERGRGDTRGSIHREPRRVGHPRSGLASLLPVTHGSGAQSGHSPWLLREPIPKPQGASAEPHGPKVIFCPSKRWAAPIKP